MGGFKGLLSRGGLLLAVALSACTKKETADPIVIPPGQAVDYSNADFVPMSQSYYSVELQKLDDASKKFFSIQDITPLSEKEQEQSVHFVVPKSLNEPGVFILKVSLPRSSVSFSAFVLPDRSIRPGIVTTLAVELFANYPGLDLNKLGVSDILAVEDEARQMVVRAETELKVSPASMSPKQWLRFMENYAARDPGFLGVAARRGLAFSVDSNGQANGIPFPFVTTERGLGNTAPIADVGNSTPRTRPIAARETEDVKVRARMQDNENDFLVYQWFLDDVPYQGDAENFVWTPSFLDSRTDPYVVKVKVSDGGLPVEIPWLVNVADRNRAPEVIGDCQLQAKETELWSCTIEAIDFDLDPISFTLSDKSTSARVTMDGQKTDDVTRKLTVTGKTSVKVEFTPDNYDARKHSAYIEVVIDDGKLGKTFVPLNVIVDDINSPPVFRIVNGSVIQPIVPGSVPHEFDTCTDTDPDDGSPSGYKFFIEVNDPDNQPDAGPRALLPDVVTLPGLAGSLTADVTSIDNGVDGCPVSTPDRTYFCFEWKPKSTPHEGTLSFTVRDDHGGVTTLPNDKQPATILLTSEDRNLNPCMATKAASFNLNDNRPRATGTVSATDADNDFPLYEVYNVPDAVIPLISDAMTDAPLTFRKTRFNPTQWATRFPKTTSAKSDFYLYLNRPLSGYLTFTRAAVHTADIVISQGTVFKTSTPSKMIQYEVAQTTVMNKDDLAVTVPVRAINRSAPVGKLNRFILAAPGGLSVTNAAVLSSGGTVTVSRATGGTTVTIPHGTEIGTDEIHDGTDTIRYETMDDVTLSTTDLSKSLRVRRLPLTSAANTVTVTGTTWPGPALTITNPIPLTERQNYTLVVDGSANQQYCMKVRALDDAVVSDLTVLTPTTAIAGVTFEAKGDTEFEGWVNVKRTSTASAQTIPAGTIIGLPNHTRYKLVEDAVFNPGDSVVPAPIVRDQAYSTVATAGGDQVCATWADINYPPQFIGAATAKVTEGATLLDFPIEVNDNPVDTSDPKDPLDRHTFTGTAATAPAGSYAFCREPGTDPANVNANCTSCATAGATYWTSAICYLRFKPALVDNGKTFSFQISVNDHGNPGGDLIRQTNINVVVVEKNDPPVFTDSSFAPVIGSSKDHPVNESAPWNYSEGVDPGNFFYLADPDWGSDTKTIVTPTLVRTWQFRSADNTWQSVANPRGLSMALTAAGTTFIDPPPGSRATALVTWKPWDEDAKRLGGAAGFVIEVRACDLGNSDSPAQCSDSVGAPGNAFYKMTVVNKENAPTISSGTPISTLTITADKYFIKDFTVQDADYATTSTAATPIPATANFQPRLSFCDGAGVYDCTAYRAGEWPAVLSSGDSPYLYNKTDTNCQNSSGTMYYTSPEFKLPAATSSALNPCPVTGNCLAYTGGNGSVPSPYTAPPMRNYTYSFRWCPQRKHIGKHTVTFKLKDNGDQDNRGTVLDPMTSTFQVILNVVAPVFFDSPKRDSTKSDGTASWWMKQAFTNTEWRYLLIPNNSKNNLLTIDMADLPAKVGTDMIGAVSLEVRSHLNPGTVLRSSVGTATSWPKVTNVNPLTEQAIIVWKPYGATTTTKYVSSATDQTTWPLFQVRLKDQTTSEGETIKFRVQVKDYANPANDAPVISASVPSATSVAVPEQVAQVFSVTATDTNSDYLHYRWFLDSKLVNDAGPSYTYLPAMDDAFTFANGLSLGQHTLSVEVTDGQERTGAQKVYKSWNIFVRNTRPYPSLVYYSGSTTTPWSLANWASSFGTISTLNWGPTIGIGTKSTVSGVTTTNNYLMFTGQYSRASAPRNFVGRLQFQNGGFTATSSGTSSTVQLREGLPWSSSRKTEHVSFILQDAANIQYILASSIANPEGVFGGTTDAVRLSPNLASYSAMTLNLSSSNGCTGTCAQQFFTGFKAPPSSSSLTAGTVISAGTESTASYDSGGTTYMFFSSENRTKLKYARFGMTATTIATMLGTDKIADVAVNPAVGRLYVTFRDLSPGSIRNYLRVYRISDVLAGDFTKFKDLKVDDGINSDNRILDLVVDLAKNRVYARLPGTGGVVYLDDPNGSSDPSTTLDTTMLHFVGVTEIAESPNDVPGTGRKLVFNPNSQLLYGVVGKQVFIIDTLNDSFGINVYTGSATLDEILTFATDGLTLAIDRTLGNVYTIK